MTTDTDSRVAEAMRLHKVSTRSHHVWQTLRALGEQDERAQAAVDDHTALMTYLAAEFDKVPCIASDPRCPCNDGDACNYVATNSTPAFEVPHPDAIQLISIADLMPTLSGADPAMLTNVGHYLRGLSDRVKALPVARTGPLRVADEAESGAVEAVPQELKLPHRDCPPTWPASPSMSKSWQTAAAVAREAPSGRTVVDSAVILAIDKRLSEAFAELQEARKIVQALECLFSPYATDSTQRDWMDRAAAMTKEKPNGRPE